ncbi:MAG: hypothetical protein ACLTEE_16620, partial [Anaerobutyricum hallii]
SVLLVQLRIAKVNLAFGTQDSSTSLPVRRQGMPLNTLSRENMQEVEEVVKLDTPVSQDL